MEEFFGHDYDIKISLRKITTIRLEMLYKTRCLVAKSQRESKLGVVETNNFTLNERPQKIGLAIRSLKRKLG